MEVKNQWKAWIYLAPALILLAIFTFYPFFKTIIISFLGYFETVDGVETFKNGYTPMTDLNWELTLHNYLYSKEVPIIDYDALNAGAENFIKGYETKWYGALADPELFEALKNTAVIAIVTVPGSTILALLISVALNSIRPLQKFLQTIYFLPYVTNSIAIGLVFAVMFEVTSPTGNIEGAINIGIMNEFFEMLGISPRTWVLPGSSWGAKMTVACTYGIWNALPFKIMILLGALQSVNKQYYEAAQVDCATKFTTFRRITVPMLSPMISYVLITGFIGAFKEYSSLIGLFGDNLSTYDMNTIVGLVYTQLYTTFNYGKAAAYALSLFVIILIFTVVQLYVSNKKVHY